MERRAGNRDGGAVDCAAPPADQWHKESWDRHDQAGCRSKHEPLDKGLRGVATLEVAVRKVHEHDDEDERRQLRQEHAPGGSRADSHGEPAKVGARAHRRGDEAKEDGAVGHDEQASNAGGPLTDLRTHPCHRHRFEDHCRQERNDVSGQSDDGRPQELGTRGKSMPKGTSRTNCGPMVPAAGSDVSELLRR